MRTDDTQLDHGRVMRPIDIPAATYYVTAVDSFMSDWGPAEGLDNLLIVPCKDAAQANRVVHVLQRRGEMRRVSMSGRRPTALRLRSTFAQVKDADSVEGWQTDSMRSDA